MNPLAQHAIRAEKMRHTCGSYSARRYAINHGCLGLYRLACQLAAIPVAFLDY